jgi:hypothetical protein
LNRLREEMFLLSLGERRPYCFPSVLLQPLGHLSVSSESAAYRPVAEPANPNCVRPLNLSRSLTGTDGPVAESRRSAPIRRQSRPDATIQYSPPTMCLGRRREPKRTLRAADYVTRAGAASAGNRKTRTQLADSRPSSTHLRSSSVQSVAERFELCCVPRTRLN